MNIKQLRQAIRDLPDDMEIVLSFGGYVNQEEMHVAVITKKQLLDEYEEPPIPYFQIGDGYSFPEIEVSVQPVCELSTEQRDSRCSPTITITVK